MKYYYDTLEGRKWVTFKRGSWKWVNYDIPSIYNKDGYLVVEVDFPSYQIDIYEDDLLEQIEKWIDASDKAFHKHFKDREWAGEYEGLLKSRIN